MPCSLFELSQQVGTPSRLQFGRNLREHIETSHETPAASVVKGPNEVKSLRPNPASLSFAHQPGQFVYPVGQLESHRQTEVAESVLGVAFHHFTISVLGLGVPQHR